MPEKRCGVCGITEPTEGLGCAAHETKGAWPADDLAQCVALCAGCARCRFVSFAAGATNDTTYDWRMRDFSTKTVR